MIRFRFALLAVGFAALASASLQVPILPASSFDRYCAEGGYCRLPCATDLECELRHIAAEEAAEPVAMVEAE